MRCDYCNNEARVNYQKVWVRFKVKEDGGYEEDKNFNGCDIEPTYESNMHLCMKHEAEWLAGNA